MKLSLLCTDTGHPIISYLRAWVNLNAQVHEIELIESIRDASGGDILFLISCSEKVLKADRDKYRKTLVLHASDLPVGRGWSPHIWDLVEGSAQITLSLLEAEDVIDSGKIWQKRNIQVPKHALWDEINHILFNAEIELIDFAVSEFDTIQPHEQDTSITPTYRRKRTPDDSRIDPEKPIAEQFDLLRVCDPARFPAFFDHHGCRYIVKLEKINE